MWVGERELGGIYVCVQNPNPPPQTVKVVIVVVIYTIDKHTTHIPFTPSTVTIPSTPDYNPVLQFSPDDRSEIVR